MVTRRQIREAAVQLIYATEFEGGGQSEEARSAFWALLLEDKSQAIGIAQAKALVHLTTGREARVEAFVQRLPEINAVLAGDEKTDEVRTHLSRLLADEKKWLKAFEAVPAALRSTSEAEKSQLTQVISDLLATDRGLISRRDAANRFFEDLPQYRHQAEQVASLMRKLQNLSERAQLLGKPDEYANYPAVAHLRSAIEDRDLLKSEAEKMVGQLAQHRDQVDQHIASLAENYRPERINPVERAVLRLGVYEILFDDDVPAAVAINEALEIVKSFSTEESYRFVNGILDAVAKTV